MSRNYSMTVIISGPTSDKTAAIRQAAAEEWDFDDWHEDDGQMLGFGEGRLGGGESEEEFADRLNTTATDGVLGTFPSSCRAASIRAHKAQCRHRPGSQAPVVRPLPPVSSGPSGALDGPALSSPTALSTLL
jgi:hypothetical protein